MSACAVRAPQKTHQPRAPEAAFPGPEDLGDAHNGQTPYEFQPLTFAHAPVVHEELLAQIRRQLLPTQVMPPRQSSAVEQKLPAPLKPRLPQSTTSTALPTFCT
jgi:hypothetical protein